MSERITGVGAITEKHGLVALPSPSRHHHLYALGVIMGFDCMPDDGGGFGGGFSGWLSPWVDILFLGFFGLSFVCFPMFNFYLINNFFHLCNLISKVGQFIAVPFYYGSYPRQ